MARFGEKFDLTKSLHFGFYQLVDTLKAGLAVHWATTTPKFILIIYHLRHLNGSRCDCSVNRGTPVVKRCLLHRTSTIGGSKTVQLTSALTGLSLTKQVKLLFIQHEQRS